MNKNKIKLPSYAIVRKVRTIQNRTAVIINGQLGWDIVSILAAFNGLTVQEFIRIGDLLVYMDHILIDTPVVAA